MSKILSLKDVVKLKESIFENLENSYIKLPVEEFLFYLSKILIGEDFKKDYKKLRKVIKIINKNFDEVYLLYFRDYNNIKFFDYFDNKFLIEGFYDTIELLNKGEKIKEAEELGKNLSKLELGFKRYFELRDRVDFFIPELKKFKLKEKEEIYFFENLDKVLNAKTQKIREREFKKIAKVISYFPQKIYDSKTKNNLELEKSLFFKENLNLKKVDKNYIENQNSIYSIYKTIKLIKFLESKI